MKKVISLIGAVFTMVLLSGCGMLGLGTSTGTGTAATTQEGASWTTYLFPILMMAVLFGAMYFIAIRPEKKREKEQKALLASMAVGDTVLTTSGFYGVVIDITNDTVIVEFGNNKNCRIPMQKAAIVQLEHPEGYVPPVDETPAAEEKPGLFGGLFKKKDKAEKDTKTEKTGKTEKGIRKE